MFLVPLTMLLSQGQLSVGVSKKGKSMARRLVGCSGVSLGAHGLVRMAS
jgi:hypothetical protein